MEKNWPGSEGDPTIANVWLGQSGHPSSQANSLFLNINSSPHFVRKCTKSRLTQGSSGRNRYISTRENFSPYLQGFKKRFLKWNRVYVNFKHQSLVDEFLKIFTKSEQQEKIILWHLVQIDSCFLFVNVILNMCYFTTATRTAVINWHFFPFIFSVFKMRMSKFFFQLVIVIHVFACAWYCLACPLNECYREENWVKHQGNSCHQLQDKLDSSTWILLNFSLF